MSKAARIRFLLETGLSNDMIADHVDCLPEYVRVVKQRLSPRRRTMDAAYSRTRGASADQRLMSRAWAIHYHGAKADGLATRAARKLANRARQQAVAATSDRAAARAAYHAAKRGNINA